MIAEVFRDLKGRAMGRVIFLCGGCLNWIILVFSGEFVVVGGGKVRYVGTWRCHAVECSEGVPECGAIGSSEVYVIETTYLP